MGGTGLYSPPVDSWTSISTYADHDHPPRDVASTEMGVDWRCPIGTPVMAATGGRVADINTWDVGPATGLYVAIDLDDGKRQRLLHLSEIHVYVGQRVAWGEVIGKSGATGYGTWDWSGDPSTGGAHVHETIFPGHYYVFGAHRTLDPWPLTETTQTARIEQSEEDDMKAIIQAGQPDSGIIIQAGVPPYSLGAQVFDALCGAYGLTAQTLADWQYATVVREQWTAAKAAAALEPNTPLPDGAVSTIVSGILSGVDEAVAGALNVDEILKRLGALPKAVVDELKARL